MDTIARVMELADERNLSLFKLSQLCDVSYSTLKNAEMRGSQLGVPTIERICAALGVTLSDFFAESGTQYAKIERPEQCSWPLFHFWVIFFGIDGYPHFCQKDSLDPDE